MVRPRRGDLHILLQRSDLSFEAAQQDLSKVWSSASELSAALTNNLKSADQANPHVAEMLAKIFDPRGWRN